MSSGEHGGDDLGCTKIPRFVKKVRKTAGMRKKEKRECGVDGARRKWSSTAAGMEVLR